MMYYFLYRNIYTDELTAVQEETEEKAEKILKENGFDTDEMKIYDKFEANGYGDDLIDNYGLDVF